MSATVWHIYVGVGQPNDGKLTAGSEQFVKLTDYDALAARTDTAETQAVIYARRLRESVDRINELEADKPWNDLGTKQVTVLAARIRELEAALREIAVSQPNSSHKHNPDYFAGLQFGIDTLAGFARKALDPQSESASITRSDIKVSDNGTTSCDYTLETEAKS